MLLIKFLWCGLLYFFFNEASAQTYQASLLEGSAFTLKGSSNINEFRLVYTGSLRSTNKVQVKKEEARLNVKPGDGLHLNVLDFKSPNSYITKDFRKMLQADIYPTLSIEPLSVWLQKNQPGKVAALINLTIAGCTRQEVITLTLTEQKATALQCKGSHVISLKKYELTAPKKALGAVQVNDNVTIDMRLNLQYKKVD
ncbi:YceI family protein [Niabella aquatica]